MIHHNRTWGITLLDPSLIEIAVIFFNDPLRVARRADVDNGYFVEVQSRIIGVVTTLVLPLLPSPGTSQAGCESSNWDTLQERLLDNPSLKEGNGHRWRVIPSAVLISV